MFKKDFFGFKKPEIKKLNVDLDIFKEEKKMLEKFVKMKNKDNWENVRKAEGNFELVELEFPFGVRKSYKPITEENNFNLQASRGLGINNNTDMAEIIEEVESHLAIQESDIVRMEEVDIIFKEIENLPSENSHFHLIKNYLTRHREGVCEIGFRTHKLMNYYQERERN